MLKKTLSSVKAGAVNWKTTLCGLGSLCSALGEFLTAQFDADPATSPNYMFISSMVAVGIGLIFSKDSKPE